MNERTARKILGIDAQETLNKSLLKSAFRKQVRVYHPDNVNTGDSKMFLKVKEAREVLEKVLSGESVIEPMGIKFKERERYTHKTPFKIVKKI